MRDPWEYAQAAHPIQPEESLEEEHQVHQQNWGWTEGDVAASAAPEVVLQVDDISLHIWSCMLVHQTWVQ